MMNGLRLVIRCLLITKHIVKYKFVRNVSFRLIGLKPLNRALVMTVSFVRAIVSVGYRTGPIVRPRMNSVYSVIYSGVRNLTRTVRLTGTWVTVRKQKDRRRLSLMRLQRIKCG